MPLISIIPISITHLEVLFTLLLCVNTLSAFGYTEHEELMELPAIEGAKGIPLLEILDDILEDSPYDDISEKSLYVYSINKFKNGLRIDIHKEENGKINERLTPLGYIPAGSNIIIVNAGDWLLKEGYVTYQNVSKRLIIKRQSRHPGVIYDAESWTFFVLEGNFARFVHKIGWVWTLNNDETDKKNLNRFLIQSPNRTGNRSNR